jgi:hypothetical protein
MVDEMFAVVGNELRRVTGDPVEVDQAVYRNWMCEHEITKGNPFPAKSVELSIIDYYDGMVSGVARCSLCGMAFHIAMLDWDTAHGIRIYGTRVIDEQAYALGCKLDIRPDKNKMIASEAIHCFAELDKLLKDVTQLDKLFVLDTSTETIVVAEAADPGVYEPTGIGIDCDVADIDWFTKLRIQDAYNKNR